MDSFCSQAHAFEYLSTSAHRRKTILLHPIPCLAHKHAPTHPRPHFSTCCCSYTELGGKLVDDVMEQRTLEGLRIYLRNLRDA